MKKITLLLIAFLLTLAGFGQNPIIQTIYTADPAPMVHNDTVFLYTSHDEDASTWFTMKDWRVYSSTDMVNWTDYGSPLSLDSFTWADGDAWAAQCISRNGKFYFYICAHHKTLNRMAIGVAVSDKATGPFQDALGEPLVAANWGDIDPTVFIDDDGQAYLYWGNPDLWYVKLNEDMISYDQTVGVVKVPLTTDSFGTRANDSDRETLYEEGPWLYKRNGLYYLVYPGGPVPEHIAYSTSASPTGPWEYRGTVMEIIGEGGAFTNHPGVIDFKGKSYFFYHNGNLPGGGGFNRSVCIEQFEYNADKTIPLILPTQEGLLNSVQPLDPYKIKEAETIAWEDGVETEKNDSSDVFVTDIDSSDYIKVRSVDFGKTGAGVFTAAISGGTQPGATSGGAMSIYLDDMETLPIGFVEMPYTGGWNNIEEVQTTVSADTGIHDLYFVFEKELDASSFYFDKWVFTEKRASHDLVGLNPAVKNYKLDTVSGLNMTSYNVSALYADGIKNNINSVVELSSSDSSIIAISGDQIIGVGYGTAHIYFNYGGIIDSLPILVKNLESELAVEFLQVDTNDIELLYGSNLPIVITAIYLDGHSEVVTDMVTISNPDENVATFSNGIIKATGSGEISILVSYQGKIGEERTSHINIMVRNRSPYDKNEAEDFSEQTGIQTEDCSDTGVGLNVGFIENGDWLKFSNLDFNKGVSSFEARVTSATNGGNIDLHLDGIDGELIGTCKVLATGGWQSWQTISCIANNIDGVHDLYLVFSGESGFLFNINWWKFNEHKISELNNTVFDDIKVVTQSNQRYLHGIYPGDIVNIYNCMGQILSSVKVSSNQMQLPEDYGFTILEIKHQGQSFILKTIL